MNDEKPCTFCQREGKRPAALGHRATGTYIIVGTWGITQTVRFNGYVCEMHQDNINWVGRLKWLNGRVGAKHERG